MDIVLTSTMFMVLFMLFGTYALVSIRVKQNEITEEPNIQDVFLSRI